MSSGSKKGTQIYYPFLSNRPGKRIHTRFPTGPLWREINTYRAFLRLSSYISIFPSDSPLREPPPCALRGSPCTGILRHQNHWSIIFIHSRMSAGAHRKEALLHVGKNIRSPSTEPHADERPTYNGVLPGSPRGSLTALLPLPECHAALSTMPSTLPWVDQNPVSQSVS